MFSPKKKYLASNLLAGMLLKGSLEEHALAAVEYVKRYLSGEISGLQKELEEADADKDPVEDILDKIHLKGVRDELVLLTRYQEQTNKILLALHKKKARTAFEAAFKEGVSAGEKVRHLTHRIREYTACLEINPDDLEARVMLARQDLATSNAMKEEDRAKRSLMEKAASHYERVLFGISRQEAGTGWKKESAVKTLEQKLAQKEVRDVFLQNGEMVSALVVWNELRKYERRRYKLGKSDIPEPDIPYSRLIELVEGAPYANICRLLARAGLARRANIPLNTAKRRVHYFGYDPHRLQLFSGRFNPFEKLVIQAVMGGGGK